MAMCKDGMLGPVSEDLSGGSAAFAPLRATDYGARDRAHWFGPGCAAEWIYPSTAYAKGA